MASQAFGVLGTSHSLWAGYQGRAQGRSVCGPVRECVCVCDCVLALGPGQLVFLCCYSHIISSHEVGQPLCPFFPALCSSQNPAHTSWVRVD